MPVSSRPPRRIVALWFPRLPTDRLRRRDSQDFSALPLVVVAKRDNSLRLTAVDARAAALGLTIGQPLANARAIVPELAVAAADAAADHAFLARLADWCDRFTPLVAFDPPHGLFLDVTGASHLAGGERALLDRLRQNLACTGLAVQAGLAGTPHAARALARYRNGAIAPPGGEAAAIAALPVEALELPPEVIHGFRRAGLKTVAQAAARKRSEIAARFGAATMTAIDAASGRLTPTISPRLPAPEDWAERNFPEPVTTREVIRDTLAALMALLAGRLERRGCGARRLEARFFRADGAVRTVTIETSEPCRNPLVALRLFDTKLDGLADPLDPGFGYDLIRLSALQVERIAAEVLELEQRRDPRREVGFLVDRLAARFGAARLMVFQPNDTHVPERAWSLLPAQQAQPRDAAWRKAHPQETIPRRPLRMFARPSAAEIVTGDSGMAQLEWRRVRRAILHSEGPERIAPEWWRDTAMPATRDYFRIEDAAGRRLWLYRDGSSAQWFVHGAFA